MNMPQKTIDALQYIKTFKERSNNINSVWRITHTEDKVIIHDSARKINFNVPDVTMGTYVCMLNNYIDHLIKEVESKYEHSEDNRSHATSN